jgi:SAM-dependent methyltransferase
MSITTSPDPDLLVGRIFNSLNGAMELFTIYVGDRLGFYRLLHENGPVTSEQLSARSHTHERSTREWLEQQAVSGFIACDPNEPDGASRTYWLPDEYAELFCDPDSLRSVVPMAQILAGTVAPISRLIMAYRETGGIPYADYGSDLHEGQARINRPQFVHLLARDWLGSMPDVVAKLESNQSARVADIGMGEGWSSIAIAKAYPNVHVDGFDLDEASVAAARINAQNEGVEDRVTFEVRDAGDPSLAGRYDLALAIECIHDMSDPVSALQSMRRLVGNRGTVLIVDEKVADAFTAPGDDVERFMYGFSVLHCLPVGLAEQPSVGTGTVIREGIMRKYAEEAGFRSVETLPVEHDMFRFYRMTA